MTPEEQRRLDYVAERRRGAQARAARERSMHGDPAARRNLQANWAPLQRGPDPIPDTTPDQP